MHDYCWIDKNPYHRKNAGGGESERFTSSVRKGLLQCIDIAYTWKMYSQINA